MANFREEQNERAAGPAWEHRADSSIRTNLREKGPPLGGGAVCRCHTVLCPPRSVK